MVKISRFKYQDLDEIVDLMVKFHEEENKLKLKKRDNFERETITEIYVDADGIEILIAEEAGYLIGYTYLNTKNPEYPNSLFIEEIYVKPQHRGKRIAGKMTTCALFYAFARGLENVYTEVRETNIANLKNNERAGFRVKKRERREDTYYLLLHRSIKTKKRDSIKLKATTKQYQ